MLEFNLHYQWDDFKAHYSGSFDKGFTCLLGGSGEGKSTLLYLLGGFLKGEGQLRFDERDVLSFEANERPITTLFQSDNVFPQLSVWDNVAIGVHPSRKLSLDDQKRVTQSLKKVQLDHLSSKFPGELSGGQVQRVSIARALVRKQPILLLDEPFSALDPALRREMLNLVKEVTHEQGLITIMVTHSPDDALFVDGKIVLVENGKLVAQDDAQVLKGNNRNAHFERYLGR
ncbi:ATP-binding cassette domain-containing protein [Marinomonas balearica]|uniref:Thiamine transport system ATP-binding protein n=1 Tax=Marinomonas balearica TaxID=491947 RepID=A0A4R6M9R8_9GAMM|nr:ATP-binding cassette domain-containing protein [Marinomonas balearica]TDO98261.1 thiamine transport system ATP-binding protein [Marinomonas balearica]